MARGEAGVLLLGPSGSGKSDLALRLLYRGYILVADDRVDMDEGVARAPPALAGLLEIRGLGIVRLPYRVTARPAIAVSLETAAERLPLPSRHAGLDLPLVKIDPWHASAPDRVSLALDCALGRVSQIAGAFVAAMLPE